MARMAGPDSVVMCNLINTHTHTHIHTSQVSGLVLRYLLSPSYRYVDMGSGWLRRACPQQGARHQTGRAQVGDILQRVPTSGGRDGSSTSSAAILFCFTADTLFPHASPSLQTGSGACEYPIAPFLKSGVCVRSSYRGGTEPEGRIEANGVGGGFGVGGGNGDGNRVGGGNGDVNGGRDGAGAATATATATATGVEVNKEAEDGNGDGSRDGAGTSTGTGVETRGRSHDEDGDGSGDRNESSFGDENGDEDGNGDGNEYGIGKGGGQVTVDAIRHFYSARVIISADRGWRLRTPHSSVCKAWCLYTRIAPRG